MLSFALALIWLVVANVLGMLPSRDNHWRRAYALIAVGIPLVGYVTWQDGPWIGLLVLAAGASILRWPLRYLLRWAKLRVRGPAE
ncbi:MAG: DUF2484 family protein [Paracoccaceae bacterium]|nr:DUF2484 family protein [Paracoccaceae bacterium]